MTLDKIANTETFTDVKDKSQDPKGHMDSHTDDRSLVCVFPRRKEHEESISSSSTSDICDSPHAVSTSNIKDDNHNTVTRKTRKKPRRAAIGFPSEIDGDAVDSTATNTESQADSVERSTNNTGTQNYLAVEVFFIL